MRLDLHKTSSLSTNDFVKIILNKNSKKKSFVETLENYNSICLKSLLGIVQKLENAFLVNFSVFFKFHTIQNCFWSFIQSIDAPDFSAVSVTTDIICSEERFSESIPETFFAVFFK